jgi:hypothetical protein
MEKIWCTKYNAMQISMDPNGDWTKEHDFALKLCIGSAFSEWKEFWYWKCGHLYRVESK